MKMFSVNFDFYPRYEALVLKTVSMERILFIIILLTHGLIHLMGFLKAYKLGEINLLTQYITKPYGIAWLVTALLFFLTLIQYVARNEWWWLMALFGVILSQFLILIFWQDAKFATVPNLIILTASIIAFSHWNFDRKINIGIDGIFDHGTPLGISVVQSDEVKDLPTPVKKWLTNSGTIGKESVSFVRLKQKALMKMKPEQEDWLMATAKQYFRVERPAFVWRVNLKMMPFIDITGRDLFVEGKGEMLIKLLSIISVVDEKGEKIDQGTMQRYLGEIVWFPSAALSPYIQWAQIDSLSAKATMNYYGKNASGTFYFNEQGDFIKYSALRYMGNEPDAKPEEWVISVQENRKMNGIRIPVKMEATWKLKTGDWTWLKLEVEDIEYNIPKRY